MKFPISRLKNRLIVFAHDVFVIPLAWVVAYGLHFNLGSIPLESLRQAISLLPILIFVQLLLYGLFGLHRGVWRFASLPDLMRIVKAAIAGVTISALILLFDGHLLQIPRSVFPLYGLLLIALLSGSRLMYRWSKDRRTFGGKRVLVVGAGQAGEGIVRDLKRNAEKYHAIGFVDDRRSKQGREIHGIRVLGKAADIPEMVKRYHIDMLIIAMPSASSADMRRIVGYCEKSAVPFRTLPGLKDLTSGSVKIDILRKVSLEDLLGREPIVLDWVGIHRGVDEKTVLISGGGGSIGAELCRQVAQLSPKKLLVIEKNEFNLYSLELELKHKFPQIDFCGYLVNVRDQVAVQEIFRQHLVDVVFHAAAYKHVPMLENQLRIAMLNNILGTKILAEAALRAQVKKFVLISTDKAVNPTNVMGATKRAAEIFCQNYNLCSQTQFITVRFGNVLGSAGSVVPLFRQQIEQGGPVTVTHPEITRFFMTIPEAAQLILQATIIGKGREIFVLDMGKPVQIRYLAEQMILLAGLVPNVDIEIQYTGLRPGEKLYEELFHESELLSTTSHEKIMQAFHRAQDWCDLEQILKEIEIACGSNNHEKLAQLLLALVPEYQGNCVEPLQVPLAAVS